MDAPDTRVGEGECIPPLIGASSDELNKGSCLPPPPPAGSPLIVEVDSYSRSLTSSRPSSRDLSGLETGKKISGESYLNSIIKSLPVKKSNRVETVLLEGERSDPLNDQLTGIPLNTIDRDAHTTQKAIAPDQRPSLIMAFIFDPDKQTHRCVDRPKLMTPT